jgi:hypothetical protein
MGRWGSKYLAIRSQGLIKSQAGRDADAEIGWVRVRRLSWVCNLRNTSLKI